MIHLCAREPLYTVINNGNDEKLNELLETTQISTDDLLLGVFQATEQNHPQCLAALLKYILPHENISKVWEMSLDVAALRGHVQLLEHLLNFHTPTQVNTAITNAAGCGHLECVQKLLPFFTEPNNAPLEAAVRHGNADGVRLLLNVCDPSLNNWFAAKLAVRQGNISCLEVLVPSVHPQVVDETNFLNDMVEERNLNVLGLCLKIFDARRNSSALFDAIRYRRDQNIIDLLYSVSDIPNVIALLRSLPSQGHADTLEARWQKDVLNSHVKTYGRNSQRKM